VSVPDTPPDPPPPRELDLGSALLILVGVILLLPGACAVLSAIGMLQFALSDPSVFVLLALLWAACLAIGYGGIKLIKRGAGR
jgi:hypothetical protein